jgi:hypothetical protein
MTMASITEADAPLIKRLQDVLEADECPVRASEGARICRHVARRQDGQHADALVVAASMHKHIVQLLEHVHREGWTPPQTKRAWAGTSSAERRARMRALNASRNAASREQRSAWAKAAWRDTASP